RVERGEVRVIPERLMMELEAPAEWIHTWLPGECVAPAARIPLPAHASLIEPIANSRPVRRVGLAPCKEPMVVVDRQQKLVGRRARAKRRLRRLRRVDRKVIAVWPRVRGYVAIDDRRTGAVQLRNEVRSVLRQRLGPFRRRGGDQELMVEERPAERRHKEIVGKRVSLR